MTKRKLLSGEYITRLEKKLLSRFEGFALRGRRKYKNINRCRIPFISQLKFGDMYTEPELEIKQLGDRFYRHTSDLHVGVDTTIPVYRQLLDSPAQSVLTKIHSDHLIAHIQKRFEEHPLTPYPPLVFPVIPVSNPKEENPNE